jgi:putative transcriptional regulator
MKGLDTQIFNFTTVKLPLRNGDILVAQPFLSEMWFNRAVISMVDYNKTRGAAGVVLNNQMKCKLDEVLDGVDSKANAPVYCGGPVSHDRLFFIHTLGPDIITGARQYAHGLYIGGNFDDAINYINHGYPMEGYIRFFIGYSGWSPGQLEDEIAEETWAVHRSEDLIPELLKGQGEPFWHRIVKKLGQPYRSWLFLPNDLQAN